MNTHERKLALKDHTREKRFEKYLDWLESWSKNVYQKKGVIYER